MQIKYFLGHNVLYNNNINDDNYPKNNAYFD